MDGAEIERVAEPKLLGVYVDEKLKFERTAKEAIKKIYKKL